MNTTRQRGKTTASSGQPPAESMPVDNYERVVNVITDAYPSLSARFQQVARFLTQNPNVVALESINAIAQQCGAHPSILVRFAQHFGFSGFKQLQALFQTRLATAAPGFHERVRAIDIDMQRNPGGSNLGFLRDLIVRDVATLQDLLNTIEEDTLAHAARLLADAGTIYLAGQMRSEPIAMFLRYVLTMLKRKVVMLDPAGGLALEMARTMQPDDVLLAISFRHYAQEVLAIADCAQTQGVPLIALTDSPLSPLSRGATVLLTVPEEEYAFSRSLAAPMCLAQCIAVGVAARLQPEAKSPPRIATVTGNQKRRQGAAAR